MNYKLRKLGCDLTSADKKCVIESKEPEFTLVGDSEAMFASTALMDIAREEDIPVSVYAKAGCSFVPIQLSQRELNELSDCHQFLMWVQDRLKDNPSRLIILNSTMVTAPIDMDRLLSNLEILKPIETFLILPFSWIKRDVYFYSNILFESPLNLKELLPEDIDENWDRDTIKGERLFKRKLQKSPELNITLINARILFCNTKSVSCTWRDELGNWLYSDRAHLSYFGAAKLWRHFMEFIERS